MAVTIHCESNIKWQAAFAKKIKAGLKVIGIPATISKSRTRESDVAVLLGTTCWRHIETDGDYLLVDRASFGDPDYVQLVWNGHGKRGNHRVPTDKGTRWKNIGCHVSPWRDIRGKVVLCGQTETYSPAYPDLASWYSQVDGIATHFRKHPQGDNPTSLPIAHDWNNVGRVVALNSSVAVESVMLGIPTVTMDGGSMAWDVTSHHPAVAKCPDRVEWLNWLAWTQWNHDEIKSGLPIKHIFEGFI